ncbi:MAG: hypothetical protein KDA33_03115, partial [Phycisphaerales bacterium]|nr:hypothetical protein [Phycisphaerales bacterium]
HANGVQQVSPGSAQTAQPSKRDPGSATNKSGALKERYNERLSKSPPIGRSLQTWTFDRK